ncbi:hypothetical protein BASA50_009154 [Batrachochytrium salamandrivorans]|uniref:non-specific serine/threonine protein kinase n=1 Tax=Batrachochytrium salamandrivorans TaxID=1357716 RepID=A0ABQ8F249_9FUNG|nr:hypothetical protein BASA50_009154 [Batrachochytrium salamandrivorans]
MVDPLLWVLHHFITHYAGQTTQGDTDDDDGDGDYFDKTFDYNPKSKKISRFLQKSLSMDRYQLLQKNGISDKSGASSSTGFKSKKAGRFLQRLGSMNKYKPFQESGTPDESDILNQSGASSSADSKSKNRRKDSVWKKLLSKSPPQQQSQPRSQSSTSHDSFQFDEMPLPDYVEKLEAESYSQGWNADQYNEFVEEETKWFELEYSLKKEMGKEQYGAIYLAIKKSNGMKVTCKSILKKNVEKYALESTPPPRCHISNPLSRPKDQSVAQCMSPRPPTLYVAHEAVIQMYLSRPGHENPYVLRVFDYFILKDKFMLIMDYFDESWVSLFSYLKKKIRLDIDEVRIIIKKVVNGMISLKQQGVFHNDLHDENVMYNLETGSVKLKNFGATDVLPLWEERRLLQSLDPPSATPKYKAGPSELKSMQRIGQLLFRLLTGIRVYIDDFNYGEFMRETILPDPDPSQSELKEKAIHLVDILVSRDPKQMPSLEAILYHYFFD